MRTRITLNMDTFYAVEGDVNFNNLVQTVVQHSAFWETINSILTATNQEQSTNTVNAKTIQINRTNSTNILSGDSTSNSNSNVTRMGWDWTVSWRGKRESLKTVTVLTAVFANIYVKKGKKQIKIWNHSLLEELCLGVLWKNWYCKTKFSEMKLKKNCRSRKCGPTE